MDQRNIFVLNWNYYNAIFDDESQNTVIGRKTSTCVWEKISGFEINDRFDIRWAIDLHILEQKREEIRWNRTVKRIIEVPNHVVGNGSTLNKQVMGSVKHCLVWA